MQYLYMQYAHLYANSQTYQQPLLKHTDTVPVYAEHTHYAYMPHTDTFTHVCTCTHFFFLQWHFLKVTQFPVFSLAAFVDVRQWGDNLTVMRNNRPLQVLYEPLLCETCNDTILVACEQFRLCIKKHITYYFLFIFVLFFGERGVGQLVLILSDIIINLKAWLYFVFTKMCCMMC